MFFKAEKNLDEKSSQLKKKQFLPNTSWHFETKNGDFFQTKLRKRFKKNTCEIMIFGQCICGWRQKNTLKEVPFLQKAAAETAACFFLVRFILLANKHNSINQLLPWSLTWNLKMMISKRNLLFRGLMYRFHVKLEGCKSTNQRICVVFLRLSSLSFVENADVNPGTLRYK